MVKFETIILKYGQNGEKTGWTYIEVPNELSEQLNKGQRKSFRVKGLLDKVPIQSVALIPIGAGDFILPLNAVMRKALAKKEGAMVKVHLEKDETVYQLNELLVDSIKESATASAVFFKMPQSHQNYYSKWVESAKTNTTQEKRITQIVISLERGQSFVEMLKEKSALNRNVS